MARFWRSGLIEGSLVASLTLVWGAARGLEREAGLDPPPLEWSVHVMAGDPLDLSTHLKEKPSPVGWPVRLRTSLLSVSPGPSQSLAPLSFSTESIVSPYSVQPIRSHTALAPGALAASGAKAAWVWTQLQAVDPRKRLALSMKTGRVPLKGTILFEAKDPSDGTSICLLLSAPSEGRTVGARCALRLQAPVAGEMDTELLLLETEETPDTQSKLLIFPSPYRGTEEAWIAAYMEWFPTETPTAMSLAPSEQGGAIPFPEDSRTRAGPTSLREDPRSVPPGLLGTARAEGAFLARDLLVSGPSTIVAALDATWSSAQGERPTALAWKLERQAVLWICDQIELQGEDCPWSSLLYLHVGALSDHLYALKPLVEEAEGLVDFRESVLRENLRHAEHRRLYPSLQAKDWLQLRGHEIPQKEPEP